MKFPVKLLLSSAIFLVACGGSAAYSESAKAAIKSDPDVEAVVQTWNQLEKHAQKEDCEAFLGLMRNIAKAEEADCPDAFAYMENAPEIDWEQTTWNSNKITAKIYAENGEYITTFIYGTTDGFWSSSKSFWN